MAENIVESIIVKLGLDGSQYNREADKAIKSNEKLNKSIDQTDKVVSTVTKTIAKWFSVLAVGTGVAKMINEVQKLNDQLFFLEKNLGMSAQSIKSWQGAASAMGGSADGMTDSIKSLNMGMNDFVLMGDTSLLPFFNSLGVSMVDAQGQLRKTDDVMLDLADSFSKMDREQAFSIASKMGIDEGTFNTLVQGRKEMEKMLEYQSKMYKSSEEELKASRALAQNRALLGQHWESLRTMLANAIIPMFVKLSEVALGIFEYLQEHQQAIQAVFKGIATVVGVVLIPILAKATVAAIAFIAPFAPFILVVGALGAAFGLLYDDYKTWAEGGNSLFDWGAFKNYIDNATISTDNLKDSFAYLLTGYTDWTKVAEDGKAWLKLKGFIDENGVSVASLIKGFQNLAAEVMQEVIPTLQGYGSIITKLFSGDFSGAASEAKSMWNEFNRRDQAFTKSMNEWIENRLSGTIDIATGQDVGTLSDVAVNKSSGLQGNNVAQRTMSLIRKHEGFSTKAYWDVNAYRTGYGSDTVTDAQGRIHKVTKNTTVSKADAERDLVRRSAIFARDARTKVGAKQWDALPIDTQAALTSVAYNYGSLSDSLAKTARTGDTRKIAAHVRSFQSHNKGINRSRRNDEADIILRSGSMDIMKSLRQTDNIDLSRAKQNQTQSNKPNALQVQIDKIEVNSSASTITGTSRDAGIALNDQLFQFTQSLN